MNSKTPRDPLSDVAVLPPEKNLELTLDEVGVENVQSQIQIQGLTLPARANASVNLVDKKSRGIHMSRLFQILMRLQDQELSWPWLSECLEQMLTTHEKLSDAGRLDVSFELPVLRKALLSDLRGWRNYPVTYSVVNKNETTELKLTVRVLYSSTCPCSASLSRQAMQERFLQDFAGTHLDLNAIGEWIRSQAANIATPHSQRSEALCEFFFNPEGGFPSAISLIDRVEEALGTPVQTAVKREDEQEFARLNAQNLMFCEDAARKLKWAFEDHPELTDFRIEVRHFESLHPHDVVAKVRKGE